MNIIFLYIFCILIFILVLNNFCFKRENYTNSTTIYIITRTGKREQCFLNLKESLQRQTSKNFVHYKTNDNISNCFLKKEKNVLSVTPLVKREKMHCPYNTYLNIPISLIDGWILIIDDDTKFMDRHFLKKLQKLCNQTPPTDVIILRIFYGKEKKILPAKNQIRKSNIDMANICIHSSLLKKYPFDENCYADWRLIEKLQKDKIKFIVDETLPLGIWANYSGKMDGYEKQCIR